jgi:hypothetical protein
MGRGCGTLERFVGVGQRSDRPDLRQGTAEPIWPGLFTKLLPKETTRHPEGLPARQAREIGGTSSKQKPARTYLKKVSRAGQILIVMA